MKKLPLAVLVLLFTASIGRASTLKLWLTADPVTDAGVDFNVYVYAQVLAEGNESLVRKGISDIAFTVYSSNTTGVIQPTCQDPEYDPTSAVTIWWGPSGSSGTHYFNDKQVDGYIMDYRDEPGTGGIGDGDLDSLQTGGSVRSSSLNVGTTGAVCLCAEVWHFTTLTAGTYLAIDPFPTGRHWDLSDPMHNGTGKNYFTSYSGTGVYVTRDDRVEPWPPYRITGPTRIATGYAGTWTMNTGSDPATEASLGWDDGNTSILMVPLPASATHFYTAAGYHTITGNVSTESGSVTPSTLGVTVVDNPGALVSVTVNGVAVTPGKIFTIDGHTFPVIAASDTGYITGWELWNGNMLVGSWPIGVNPWSPGGSYNYFGGPLRVVALSDPTVLGHVDGQSYPFYIEVPEPATMSLMLLGAAAMLRIRGKRGARLNV